MKPDYLVPETECREDGAGPVLEAHPAQCLLTLGITHVMEREGLEVSIWGSEDGENWGAKPLVEFPRKSYCGRYSMTIDLRNMTGIRQLRAAWKMRSWAQESRGPLFGFYVQMTELPGAGVRAMRVGA